MTVTDAINSEPDIRQVPQVCEVRLAVRREAAALAAALSHQTPPGRDALEEAGREVLRRLELPQEYLGFAMVAVDNAFWLGEYQATPKNRRLLLLPKCLSKHGHCPGTFDTIGLSCAGCGACEIKGLKEHAEALGYSVVVAEGTSSVILKVLEGDADAILGVACLESLEKSFERIADLGIPHQAIPLLTDGCVDTTAEVDLIHEILELTGVAGERVHRSYLPLLRFTRQLFETDEFDRIVEHCSCRSASGDASHTGDAAGAMGATDAIARQWLRSGGKRLRPFITLAAYAVGKHGAEALSAQAQVDGLLPPAVRRLAVAIEAMHKASLVHDDIEDKDSFRYGQPTIHQRHGIEAAINVGDYLVGLGYRLIATQAPELGPQAVADILNRLSSAHLQLCCGQGTELLWNQHQGDDLRPVHALQIGALKTAPAFEVALYAGLRAADVHLPEDTLRQFAVYIGEGYQVYNDLEDWEEESNNKLALGRDIIAGRPTILRAFALEAGGAEQLAALTREARLQEEPAVVVERVRELYVSLGAMERAEVLYARLRERALDMAGQLGEPALQELLRFLARNVLRKR